MAPHFAAAAAELEPLVRFAKLDTEAAPDVSARFGIRGIPCMIMFRGGREVARQAGSLDKRAIVAFITGAS
jgi:thioredoxin 2